MTVKNVFTYLPEKSECNAHCDKNSILTKKTERLTHRLHSNVTRMRVTFEGNARGLLSVEDGSYQSVTLSSDISWKLLRLRPKMISINLNVLDILAED